MKKLTVLALSLSILGLSSATVHAAPKNTKTTTTKTSAKAKPSAKSKTNKKTSKTTSAPTIQELTAGTISPLAPQMRSEITTTIINNNAANLLATPIAGLPTPAVTISDIQNVPTVLTPANQSGNILMDTTLMDEFIATVSPNARHYPPSFPTVTAEYLTTQNVKHLSDWIEPFANASDASFDIVLRAAKLNGIARNLNVGTDYSVRASNHMQKALRLKPNHPEANFLLGMMISEAGGFNEGKKYLDKSVSLGYIEAEQSLAQADLLNDKKDAALSRLKALQAKHPDNAQIANQIKIINEGGYYIWRSDDKPLNIKPVK
ncbi:hypothetical protein LU276_05710 [Moraxella haemolytica]|uniref:tetratricopeptide repeat protein n=1 Tax=Moraxella haemolytica TaxID=2904119 RepID=UPI002543AFD8|nr:hypothetical protein [Moraxella sp. ZY171148]WII94530.1 hypothetical protein LU276_05710 [Moraxella sp. ZY171148]